MTQPDLTRVDPVVDAQLDQDPPMESGISAPGFRLPAATSLGHVSLQVADLARSLTYYQRVLGLSVLRKSDTTALLGTAHGDTPLVQLAERKGANPIAPHDRLGLYHFAILLPDRPALGRFIQHLSSLGVRMGASDHLVSEALYLRDPDGLGIEVYADRPRSSWRSLDRQLQMATLPLDLDDVVRSAGGAPWTGIPAGTTMGHVHLHVADLAQASAFYHETLGLDKMVWAYPGALFLAAGGYHHHLGLNTWAGENAPRPTDADARLLEWRIVVPSPVDLRSAVESFRSAGYPVVETNGTCAVSDPWGTSVRLVA